MNLRARAKEALRAPLQVQKTEELLSNMTLEKTPEILRLLSRTLNLTDDDIDVSSVKDRDGNVYKFTLIKLKGINRCLLKIPIEISTIQGRDKGGIHDAIERVENGLLLKFGDEVALFIIIVHDGKIHVSFKTNATIWMQLHEKRALIVKFISVEDLLELKEEDQDNCRIFLEDFFNLDHLPAGVENITRQEKKLATITPSPEFEVAISARSAQPTTDISQLEKTIPITVLFLAANPAEMTPLDLSQEYNAISDEIEGCKFREEFNLQQRFALRADQISKQLLMHNPQIVHFSGHGNKAGKIILQDATGKARPVGALAVSNLFSVLKDNIRCVVLNACYSEIQAMLISKYIDCVIGMSTEIGDEAAIEFAQGFYRGIGFGKDLETAFKIGCAQINLQGLEEEQTPKILWKNDESKKIVLVNVRK